VTIGEFDLLSANGIDPNTVDLVFSNGVAFDSVAMTPATYVLSGGLAVLSVQQTADNVIRLTTTTQGLGTPYSVSIAANPTPDKSITLTDGSLVTLTDGSYAVTT
jgi:hypothetical protein